MHTKLTRLEITQRLVDNDWLPQQQVGPWHQWTKRNVRVWVLDVLRPPKDGQSEITRICNPLEAHPAVDVPEILAEVERLFDGYTADT